MDGNGRWAKKRGLPRTAGHGKGVKRVKEIVKEAKNIGIKVLTVFAFSTENWLRPKKEINILFTFLSNFLNTYEKELMEEGICLRIIGRKSNFDKKILKKMAELEEATKNNKNFIFNVALDYGGRWDILNAVNTIVGNCNDKKSIPEAIDEDYFRNFLALGEISDPELLIRTSGEQRISNFLLWNLAYSELYFTPLAWPDFDKKQLHLAIEAYSHRQRRFGGAN